MRAALLLASGALAMAGCAAGSSTAPRALNPARAEAPPSHAEQAAALAAKRQLRALVVRSAQACSASLRSVSAASAAEAARRCAGLQLAEDPFRPEAAPSTAHGLQRDLAQLAAGGAAAGPAAARLSALPEQLSYAVTRVILSPPQAARRTEGVLERSLRVTVPVAAAGNALAAAELEGLVAAARDALAALAPLAALASPGQAAGLARAEARLPTGLPPAGVGWSAYAHALGAEAAAAAALATELHAFRQGGAYV